MFTRMILCIFLLFATTFKRIQNAKVGDKCTISQTTLTGTCRKMEDCIPAKQDFDLDGIEPTLCKLDFYDINHVFFCCQDVAGTTTSTTQSPETSTKEVENTNKRISERKCEEYNRDAKEFIEQVNLDQFADPLSGSEAQLNEFPHMAQIWNYDGNNTLHFTCVGSLISPRFVLGVSQCKESMAPYAVRLGDLDWFPDVEDGANPLWFGIKKLHIQKDFDISLTINDIMLIELEQEVTLSDAIRPACLWQTDGVGDFQQAVLSGWHLVHPNFVVRNSRLKKIVLYLYNNEECSRIWSNNTIEPNERNVTSSQICAGDYRGYKDTCNGDSGAPLQVKICKKKCLNYVIGLTSLGASCGTPIPGIYTRVSSFLDWIESIVWPET